MELGIVLTDDNFLDHLLATARAAQNRAWGVNCFLTDRGVKALGNDEFVSMVSEGLLQTALCELSVERYREAVPHDLIDAGRVQVGGQYRNAELVKRSDFVLVF